MFPGQRCQLQVALSANSVHTLHSNVKRKTLSTDIDMRFRSFWAGYDSSVEQNKSSDDALHPHVGRNLIVSAVCPQLHGMFYVKLCLLLTLIGGSAPSLVEGQRTDPTSYSPAPEVDSVPGTDDEKTDGNVGSGGVSLEGGIHRRFQSHMV